MRAAEAQRAVALMRPAKHGWNVTTLSAGPDCRPRPGSGMAAHMAMLPAWLGSAARPADAVVPPACHAAEWLSMCTPEVNAGHAHCRPSPGMRPIAAEARRTAAGVAEGKGAPLVQ
jgi:hypothetical protein